MLDERKTAILRAVVQEYIETAQPVGSGHVADAPGVHVSPATVRNEMAVLEQEGYLVQPHTSAGRIPTDKGYRFFVDHLTAPGRLDEVRRQQVGEFFRGSRGALEVLLRRTGQLLNDMTAYASVVVGPSQDRASVRSVQIVRLSPRHAPWWWCCPTAPWPTSRSNSARTSPTPRSTPPALDWPSTSRIFRCRGIGQYPPPTTRYWMGSARRRSRRSAIT